MCGITGFFNTPKAVEKTISCLKTMKNRGKDGCGYYANQQVITAKTPAKLKENRTAENCVGHCLHAVVGTVPQPLKKNGVLVANCEIYNWKELAARYFPRAENDAGLLLHLLDMKKNSAGVLKELNGVFACAYWNKKKVTLFRDVLGEKPLWYSLENGLAFASEKKALEKQGYSGVQELNPRTILTYDISTNKTTFSKQPFFPEPQKTKKPFFVLKKEFQLLLEHSISSRCPQKKLGILFSGGVDSTLIALICKKLGISFTCYTGGIQKGTKEPGDCKQARIVAQKMNFPLKINMIPLKRAESYLKKVVSLIENNTAVKAGVALPFFLACEKAKEDGVKVLFSGSGADELFAGYNRFDETQPVAKETISHLRRMYEKDLYRDDVVAMHHSIELRLPFLDKKIVRFALALPDNCKITKENNKIIVRELAKKIGLAEGFAERKKIAAQYGSNADWAIEKHAKQGGYATKSAYLKQFYAKPNLKLAALVSGGKDSLLALEIMKKQNYKISCLITMNSTNKDSYMFHTPNTHVVQGQADALGIPLIVQKTNGKKEDELEDLKKAVQKAAREFQAEGIVCGALYSNYQRERVEEVGDACGVKVFAPLWHMDQEAEMKQLLRRGYNFVFSSVAAQGLSGSWVGKKVTKKRLQKLVELNEKWGVNVAGEGGEFETLVLDMPLFSKRITIIDSETIEENEYTARLIVKQYALVKK